MGAEPDVAAGVAAAVAAHGLATTLALPAEPLPSQEFAALLARVEHHRLAGFLGTAVRDGAFCVTDDQRAEVEALWSAWCAHALRLERMVLDATAVLERHGIASVTLKGLALAHTRYPDPAVRVFGDADLLIEAPHFTRAANLLIAETGATRPLPELRRGFDDRFGKEIMLTVGRLELDLHRTFVAGALGQAIPLPDLFAGPQPYPLGGRTLDALAPTPMLLHTAYAALFGDDPPRLASLRDLAQQVVGAAGVTPGPPADAGDVLAAATRWRARAVLAGAITLAARTLGLAADAPLVAWARAYRPTRLEAALVHAHRGAGRGYRREAAALLVVPGVRGRAAYLRAIALPDPAYRRARGFGRLDLARHARDAGGLRWWSRRSGAG